MGFGKRLRNKRGIAAIGSLLLAFVIAALGSSASMASSASSGGRTLTVNDSFILKTVDPAQVFEPYTGMYLVNSLYSTLLAFRGSDVATPVPALATSYKASDGGRVYTFHLRHGLKFSNGDPLTSADVVFSFKRLINLKASEAFLLAGETVSAPNRNTVVLRSKAPNGALPYIIPAPSLGIVDAKVVKAHGGTDAPNAAKVDKAGPWFDTPGAVSSGPYVMKSFSLTSQIILKANPNYWGPKPYFSTVIMRNVNPGPQLMDIQRGGNQVALTLSPSDAASLHGKSVRTTSQHSGDLFYMFATEDPKVSAVTSNPDIQKAIRYGINYPEIARLAGKGTIQAAGVVPSTFAGALPQSDAIPYDPAKAKAAIAASGIHDPALTLTYISDLNENGVQEPVLAQAVQASLNAVGFQVTLHGGPMATTVPFLRAGDAQLGIMPWGPDYPEAGDYVNFIPGGVVGQRARWMPSSDPGLVALGARALATTNPKKRVSLFQQMQLDLNQQSPIFPLVQPAQVLAFSKGLTGAGLEFNPMWGITLGQIRG